MVGNIDLAKVMTCAVDDCSYNHTHTCSAAAVTIGARDKASCVTFIPLSIKGGLDRVQSFVGACQMGDCVHNDHLECTAAAVRVGADNADCLTYAAR